MCAAQPDASTSPWVPVRHVYTTDRSGTIPRLPRCGRRDSSRCHRQRATQQLLQPLRPDPERRSQLNLLPGCPLATETCATRPLASSPDVCCCSCRVQHDGNRQTQGCTHIWRGDARRCAALGPALRCETSGQARPHILALLHQNAEPAARTPAVSNNTARERARIKEKACGGGQKNPGPVNTQKQTCWLAC